MRWQLSDRFEPATRRVADRHYNRQKIGSDQFVPPWPYDERTAR